MEQDNNQDLLDFIAELEKEKQEEAERKAKVIAPFLFASIIGCLTSYFHITPDKLFSFFSDVIDFFRF